MKKTNAFLTSVKSGGRRIIKKNDRLIRNNIITYAFYFCLLIFLFVRFGGSKEELFDLSLASSFFIVLLIEGIATCIKNWLLRIAEDDIKLETDYDKLSNMYKNETLLNAYNCGGSNSRIPIILESIFDNAKFVIVDSNHQYRLPPSVENNFAEIMQAHKGSNIYNQTNIRVDRWQCEHDSFEIYLSRTTYFDSLVTNRAMDYEWANGITNRERFLCGPYVSDLSTSLLSNHLGFNGFIQSSDGFIPFVKRNYDVTIGKNTYGNSIGASLKVKYALKSSKDAVTEEGILNAMKREVQDELKISDVQISSKNIIAAYRDLVEGGKPQLLFYLQVDQTQEEIDDNFKAELSRKKKTKADKKDKENKGLEDGEELLWIHVDELKDLTVTAGEMIYKNAKYDMLPSASGSIVILLMYLGIMKRA